MLVGGEWADTELVEAEVEAVVMVSVEGFDGVCCCCCCWVHTSETGRVVDVVGTTVLVEATTTAGFTGVTDTPGDPCGVVLLMSLMVCCDY